MKLLAKICISAALITYISDLFSGSGALPESAATWQTTLDHSVWFSRPARSGEWVLMDLVPRAVSAGRAMYNGTLAEDVHADHASVYVKMSQDVPTVFLRVVRVNSIQIRAEATARPRYGIDRADG